jgi:meso-butanediol dehydrogenase / (S,S)-butanediol dehydrogenase / diacetyl reductase
VSKIIVITGAGVGLGRALARRFAADGESVVLLGRTASKVEAAAAEIGERAMAVACDVSSPDSVRAAFARIAGRHPRIDVLINNAAIFQPFLIVEATDHQITKTVATNLTGPMLCSRAAIPMMAHGSHIFNLSSEALNVPLPHLSVYQSTKAGLEQFSQSLLRELEPNGIRVTVVRAGAMFEEDKSWDVDPRAAMEFHKEAIAAGIDLARRPMTHFSSATNIFRALIDMPVDLNAWSVYLHARAPD